MGSVVAMPKPSAPPRHKSSGMLGKNAQEEDRRRVFPDDGLFRANTVVQIIDVSRSTWYGWVRAGIAPKPVKIGSNTFWRGRDIWNFVEEAGNADA